MSILHFTCQRSLKEATEHTDNLDRMALFGTTPAPNHAPALSYSWNKEISSYFHHTLQSTVIKIGDDEMLNKKQILFDKKNVLLRENVIP